jgi:hypothetical protein
LWAPTISESIACGHRSIASKGAIAEDTPGGGPATTTSVNEPPGPSPPTCPNFQLTPRGTDVRQADADNANFDFGVRIEIVRQKNNKKLARRVADTAPTDGADAAAADSVGPSEPRAPDAAAEGRQLFIFNLPFEADEAVIVELFSSYRCTGPPVLQFNSKSKHGEAKFSGRALLDMESPTEATAAIATVHGALVGDRPVSVCFARTKLEHPVPTGSSGRSARRTARGGGAATATVEGGVQAEAAAQSRSEWADGIVDLLNLQAGAPPAGGGVPRSV